MHVRDCGVFVVGYAEYLSEGMDIPSVGFETEYHRMRYMALLWNYGLQKAKKGYVSDNDHPPRPRTKNVSLPNETGIVSIQ
ncbi:hypothetical protein T459_23380 [Capsicum annuum]|uniref:Ubiquitin-like protease family profile domain-containing protein n=1 Tax=Capsicum annuum TaxID=4072 RepID=A0A2G2YSE6_CAPAN|nr:putative protein EIN4-like [Capsicum annuum]PHT72595.1 hypothetical protein T459_23380 [Capsicum annuum]